MPEPDVEVLSEDPCSVELDFSTNDAAVQVFTIACNEMGGAILTLHMEGSTTCEYSNFEWYPVCFSSGFCSTNDVINYEIYFESLPPPEDQSCKYTAYFLGWEGGSNPDGEDHFLFPGGVPALSCLSSPMIKYPLSIQ